MKPAITLSVTLTGSNRSPAMLSHSASSTPVSHTSSSRRVTVGYLTANIHIGSGRSLWSEVVRAAEACGANLICFPGGGLRAASHFEAQRNVIYDLVDPRRLDGLISWSSTVGGSLPSEEVQAFHRRYQPLPLVSLAQLMDDATTVLLDSYEGMRAAIIHLIEVHGYRRLAFIRGPESHYYAQERYRAYTTVLREYDIPFVPELVTQPLQWEAGAEAVRLLLDERRLRPSADFQAIVAVSDLLALGALKTLQARGFQVPGEIALVGFNDSLEGRLASPPLTSVALPFDGQGTRAVEMLLAQLAGETTPAQVVLPSRLVVRQSCGCPSAAVEQAATGLVPATPLDFPEAFAAFRDSALAEASAALGPTAPLAQPLLEAFQADLSAAPPGCFLPTLEKILEKVVAQEGDLTAWHGAISALRRRALPFLAPSARALAEDLFGQARVVIGEAALRAQTYRQWQAERQADLMREIGQALITTFDVDKLAEVLADNLPRLGIASCYLALYEQPGVSFEYSRLVLAYTEQGRAPLEPGGQRFISCLLAPDGLLPQNRRYSLVVEPLFFREAQIGFALFEIGPRDSGLYEVLRGYLSSALKGALLFHDALQARLAAEKADQIKTRLLANVGHELRTPLNIIVGCTQNALGSPQPYGLAPTPALVADLQHIQHSAEHQLRIINDLLDLSRAEIDELDLCLELLDPQPLLAEAFHSLADVAHAEPAADSAAPPVTWQMKLPERLPLIQADPVRLSQILLNLLSNARKFTVSGHICLGAEVAPPRLHVWVEDTGPGISPEQQEYIFEPFVTAERNQRASGGIGLGLSITRHLVSLHGGTLTLESQPGQGSCFHLYLPLPSLSDDPHPAASNPEPVLLLISTSDPPAPEIVELSQHQGLAIHRVRATEDWETALAKVQPAAVAWDLANASPADWAMVRRFRNQPRLQQAPFILYGQTSGGLKGEVALTMGLTSFVVKTAGGQPLLEAINAAGPAATGPVLIVDDEADVRAAHQALVTAGLPGYAIRTAENGEAALAIMAAETPSLVVLDLMMPGLEGTEVLDRMRADPRLRQVPVVILSSKVLSLQDVKRLERYAQVTFQSKGVLSQAETIAALNRALFGTDTLPQHTSGLVKRAVAYLHQNYTRPISRWEIAEAIGVSEDYLSRVFSRELGLSPWDYLNRYRVSQAKELLRNTDESIRAIAWQAGFKDQAYFSRVFRKLTGLSPQAFRETSNS
jgi:signal transduction histidine kinase/DNA-binding LacI/PurR family transcriptional regulator/AraC-like DNA-binding protein